MRALKLCMVLGVIGAMAIPVSAVTLATGRLELDITNYDMGVLYTDDTEWPDSDGVGPTGVNDLTQTLFVGAGAGLDEYYSKTGAKYTFSGGVWKDSMGVVIPKPTDLEDAWLIFRVNQIRKTSGVVLWNEGDQGLEILGIAYGLHDVAVGSYGTILSDEYRIKMWEQPAGWFDSFGVAVGTAGHTQGTAGRTGFDAYTGIGDNGASNLLFAGMSTPGVSSNVFNPPIPAETFEAPIPTFSHTAPPLGAGAKSGMFIEVHTDPVGTGQWDNGSAGDGEIQADLWDDHFSGVFLTRDIHAKSDVKFYDPTIDGGGFGNWLFKTNDPVRMTFVVPEPVTVFGALCGLASLVGYIRRRNRH